MIDKMKAPTGAKKQESMKKYSAPIAAIAALSAALATASCADDREVFAPGTGANTTTSGQGGAAGEAGNGSGAEGGQGGEGGGVTCEDSKENCGGTCVDLTTDLDNCGECGNSCENPTGFCVAGDCESQCNGDTYQNCCVEEGNCDQDFPCTNLQTNDKHCGGCGIDCDDNENCDGGYCKPNN